MLSIATNIGASFARTATVAAVHEMGVSMQRLSTGNRINAARDDAAGVAIASRLEACIRGKTQQTRNVLDARALVDVAEGGLNETEKALQRLRELVVQASNDTNSDMDRQNLNSEAQQLLKLINNIAACTTWAGTPLLDGSFSEKKLGANGCEHTKNQASFSIDDFAIEAMGISDINLAQSDDPLNISDPMIINFAATDPYGVSVDLAPGTYTLVPIGINEGGKYDSWSGSPGERTWFYEYTVTATELGGSVRVNWPSPRYPNPKDAIRNAPSYTFTITQQSNVNISRYDNPGEYNDNSGGLSIKLVKPIVQPKTASQKISAQLSVIDLAIQKTNLQRAKIGSMSNALSFQADELNNSVLYIRASLSRIRDADYAHESTKLAKASILMEAATAMLAQANASKQGVLQLLKS